MNMTRVVFGAAGIVGMSWFASEACAYDCVSIVGDEPQILGHKVTLRNVCPFPASVDIQCSNGRKSGTTIVSCGTDWISVSAACGNSSQGFTFSFPTSDRLCLR